MAHSHIEAPSVRGFRQLPQPDGASSSSRTARFLTFPVNNPGLGWRDRPWLRSCRRKRGRQEPQRHRDRVPPLGPPPSLVAVSLYGNFIGTDLLGAAGLGNVNFGLLGSDLQTATIGDGTVAGRNVFAGNGEAAIDLTSATFTGSGVSISGNYIGVKPDGLTALANDSGIVITGFTATTIGGTTEEERNVIAGNTNGAAIVLVNATLGFISGNYIGVGKDGTTVRPNGSGIELVDSGGIQIGVGPIAPGAQRDRRERRTGRASCWTVRSAHSSGATTSGSRPTVRRRRPIRSASGASMPVR